MISDSQNLPIPSSNPPTRHFKPYFPHEIWVVEPLPCDFRKRYYKHIHSLSLKPEEETFIKRIPMPKTLRSLNLDSWRPGENLPLVKKLVKPYKKYLNNIQGSASHPKIQKLLPLLNDLEVSLTQDSFRILSLHSNFKTLHFNFLANRLRKTDGEVLLRKLKGPLSRNFAKINGMKSLSMKITIEEAKSALLMLKVIDQNLSLDSLEHFSLNFVSGIFSKGPQTLPEQKASISKVLSKVTHLSLDSTAWYSFLISCGKLTSLSVLNLRLASKDISPDSKGLLHFHNLPRLHKFSLSFTANSEPSEMAFFENFSLSSSVQDFSLTLTSFTLSGSLLNDESSTPYIQFFNRLQEAKGVKAFHLKITENPSNVTLTAKFACLLIKCFDSLETLEYSSRKEGLSLFEKDNTQPQPLDFQDFWAAAGNSKETLHTVLLSTSEILFPEEIHALETGFSRLQKLELRDSISSATEIGRFCQKIPSLTKLTLEEVKFRDEEKLRIFLDGMKEILKEADFSLYLNVKNIKQALLIDCVKNYIEDVKVKGRLRIHFTGVQVEEKQAFGEILKLALEKGCFGRLSMNGSCQLFSVVGTMVLGAADGLTSN